MKLINQQLIKDTNLKLMYRLIYQNRGISRAELAKLTSLSRTTVSSLIDELISRRFILDTGTLDHQGSVGRRPNGLEVRNDSYYVLVIRWSESHIEFHLSDICGFTTPVARADLRAGDSYPEVSRRYVDELLHNSLSRERILGICVVVPAMIDPDSGEIFTTTFRMPSGESAQTTEQLRELFSDFPVALLNDTACFAYAEKIFSHVEEPDFAFINFDRGIGAALFIGNELLGRACASCTQFGHYSINPDGRPCPCGGRGCLEQMIGEDSLQERMDTVRSSHASGALSTNPLSPGPASASIASYAQLGRAVLDRDADAQEVIRGLAHDFSLALCNLICMVNPRLIILGGKARELGPLFIEEIGRNLQENGFRRMVDRVEIRCSLLDDSACFCGAMKYFFDIHYRFTADMTGTFLIG